MIFIKYLLLMIISLLGIPAGMLISKYTKEEIKKGKFELKVLMDACIILAGLVLAFKFQQEVSLTVLGFIFFLSLTSLQKA